MTVQGILAIEEEQRRRVNPYGDPRETALRRLAGVIIAASFNNRKNGP
jgi:hypothetical protein